MVLRFIHPLLLLCLLLLMCDHGNTVKDLKEKHSSANFHKNCDEAEEKTSSKSSYITHHESKYKLGYGAYAVGEADEKIARLENKYKPDYGGDEVEEKIPHRESKYKPDYGEEEVGDKDPSSSAYIAQLESKYKSGYEYEVHAAEEKIASLERKYKPGNGGVEDVEKIVRLDGKKYKPGYVVDEVDKKIDQLENKYRPSYVVDDEDDEKIAHLENKYKSGYVVDEADKKIARLESKYNYGDKAERKSSSPSAYIARLENKYQPDYGVIEAEEKDSSSSSHIVLLGRKYQPDYGVIEAEENDSSPSSHIASLERKNQPDYGVIEAEEKDSSPAISSAIALLENKYRPDYGVIEANEKDSSSSSQIEHLERKYQPDYGVLEAEEKDSSTPSHITRLERKYQPDYGVIEAKERSFSASSHTERLESIYEASFLVDEDEGKSSTPSSSKRAEHHNMEHDHGHDDDIGSEDVGVFTVDDVRAFYVGRKLSTFFSIRKRSLYPGFLPSEVADSIPFSSLDIPKILQFFSVSPDSPKGKAIKDTIRRCEIEPAKGEIKMCATSSESMLEFLKTAFGGADIKLITTSHPTMTTPILQSYTVLEPPREIESPRKMACHPLPYLYGIYMCHYDATETKIFKVLLVGDNGDKVDAVIVCHMDTSAWSPKHSAFSLLGTKPGIPVCHAFSEGHGVWIQSSPKKVAAV